MRITLLVLILSLCWLPAQANTHSVDVAIIIDDMGNKHQDATAFNLPINVTFAILPNKRLSRVFAERANAQTREIIIHMPMESLAGQRQEDDVILASMSVEQMQTSLARALQSVPYAVGLNNHMGSKLTQLASPMEVTMDFLLQQGLYFLDSRTTDLTLAETVARESGVPAVKRNVFLDHDADIASIREQFFRLMRLAKKYGQAVGIAHPYPQTLQFLAENLAYLDDNGIRLVKLSALVAEPTTPATPSALRLARASQSE